MISLENLNFDKTHIREYRVIGITDSHLEEVSIFARRSKENKVQRSCLFWKYYDYEFSGLSLDDERNMWKYIDHAISQKIYIEVFIRGVYLYSDGYSTYYRYIKLWSSLDPT